MMTTCSGVASVMPCPKRQRRSTIGTMTPRRFRTPRTYSCCFGRWLICDQPLISRTAMMSTPYCSLPMAKLMNCAGPAAVMAVSAMSVSIAILPSVMMGWSLIDCRFGRVAERRYRLRYSDGGHVEMTGKLNVGVFGQADILTRPYLNKIAYELIEVELNLRRCSRLPIYFDNRSRRHRRSRRDRNEYQAPSRPAGITRDSGGNSP